MSYFYGIYMLVIKCNILFFLLVLEYFMKIDFDFINVYLKFRYLFFRFLPTYNFT